MPLDPALDGFLAKLDKEFDPPPHLLAATEFRALIERLSAEGRPERPAGLAIEDLIVSHNGRTVGVRIYLSMPDQYSPEVPFESSPV